MTEPAADAEQAGAPAAPGLGAGDGRRPAARLVRRWRSLGALSAVSVVGVAYVVLFPATLLLDNPLRRVVGCVVLAALVVHCLARPAGGVRVFVLAGLSCATCTILDDIIAQPRWIGLMFAPFALLMAWYEDHPDENEDELA